LPETHRSLLHFGRIRDLADQLESRDDTLTFLETYLQMLPGRLQRILNGIHDGDEEATHDAVLSLKVASSMTGALEIERTCVRLQSHLKAARLDQARIQAQALSCIVSRLYGAAQAVLQQTQATLETMPIEDNGYGASLAA
jgi:HPt (histidine-containing phosphotransfer) domain-containing protein